MTTAEARRVRAIPGAPPQTEPLAQPPTQPSDAVARTLRSPWAIPWTVLAVGAVVLQLSRPQSHALALTTVVGISAVQVWTLRRARGESVPFAAIPVVVFNAVGAAGYYFYNGVADTAVISHPLETSDATFLTAARIFATASACAWLGGLIAPRYPGVRELSFARVAEGVANLNKPALLLGSIGMLGLVIAGRGFHALLERSDYLAYEGPGALVKVGQALLPFGLALAATAMFDRKQSGARLVAAGVVAAYFLTYFSLGTRGFSMMPSILLITAAINGRRLGRTSLGVWLPTTYFFLQLPLALRGDFGKAGLLPWITTTFNDPGSLVLAEPGAAIGNVLYAVPLTGTVAEGRSVTTGDLLTSLNPLPGWLTNWEGIRGDLRIDPVTPFSGLGELGSFGLVLVATFFLAIGALLSVLQCSLTRLSEVRALFGSLAGIGLTLLFSITMLQYNLRAGARIIWYLGILLAAIRVVPSTRGRFGALPRLAVRRS